MQIEKDGIVYRVIEVVDRKKELQEKIKLLRVAVDQYQPIETKGLPKIVLAVIEGENKKQKDINDSLIVEIELFEEELKTL